MKIAVTVGTVVLGLFLTTGIPANALRDHDDNHRGGDRHDQGHNNARDDHGRPQQHVDERQANWRDDHRDNRHAEYHPDHNRPVEHQPHYRPADEHVRSYHAEPPHPRGGDVWARERAHHWEREHRSWHERGGYVGYRIPDREFHERFGRGHWFRVYGAPMVVVDGRPRFQYSGFWFAVVDPWPETWAANWYQTDDVYVDYVNDGYYLCNRSHPGVHIAVNVSF